MGLTPTGVASQFDDDVAEGTHQNQGHKQVVPDLQKKRPQFSLAETKRHAIQIELHWVRRAGRQHERWELRLCFGNEQFPICSTKI